MPIRYFESEIAQQNGKYPSLKCFRINVIKLYKKWFNGEMELFDQPVPKEGEKIYIGNKLENAILTWASLRKEKYLKKFDLDKDIFNNKIILDIGPGGIPFGLIFRGAKLICIDPLIPFLKEIGYPFEYYDSRATFIVGFAEDIPLKKNSVNVILSMNMDHFDDFGKAAKEIQRVAKDNCLIRLLISYHHPSSLEPLQLNDEFVKSKFDWCSGFRKIKQVDIPDSEISKKGEVQTLWTNFNGNGELYD